MTADANAPKPDHDHGPQTESDRPTEAESTPVNEAVDDATIDAEAAADSTDALREAGDTQAAQDQDEQTPTHVVEAAGFASASDADGDDEAGQAGQGITAVDADEAKQAGDDSAATEDKASDDSDPEEDEESEEANARELTEEEKQQLALNVEAAILTTDRAISPAKLSQAMDKLGVKAIREAVDSLNALYEETGRSFRIELVSNGYRFMTLPRFANVLASMKRTRSQTKLSPSALETLAVVAYKQPVLRADIEAVRGVACGETLRALMERGLVKIVGRSDEIGRPMLYGTTPRFLEVFGLGSLKDLPKAEDLRVNG